MNIQEASKLFQTIADPNRLTILDLLTKKLHMCGNDFLKYVSCKQATLSHHLKELADSELVKCNKKGTKVIYSLNLRKYYQLSNYLSKVDRLSEEDTPKVEETKEEPIRVVDTPIIKNIEKEEKKEERIPENKTLPFYLL